MKSFIKITKSRLSNVTQLKFQVQISKDILAKKFNLNDEHLCTAKTNKLKPFQCTIWNFSTKWNCVLSKHVRENEGLGAKAYLNTHQRTVHENEKPQRCDICQKLQS